MLITRLAPSPTGLLHPGNAWSFLLCWLYARANNGTVLLRIDDIDPQRSKPEYERQIIADLRWLGLDWDEYANSGLVRQSERTPVYTRALETLEDQNLVYPCFCSRRELRQVANAPHIGDEGAVYDGRCRALNTSERRARLASGAAFSLRLRCLEEPVNFVDAVVGPCSYGYADYGGDFALRRSDGVWAYQLASVVDDLEMGVNLVLRGRDLLPSTPRQILLARAFGKKPADYAHVPLILDEQGERLAKRHASLSLAALREQGIAPEKLIGWLGYKAGILAVNRPALPKNLLAEFRLDKLPKNDIRFSVQEIL